MSPTARRVIAAVPTAVLAASALAACGHQPPGTAQVEVLIASASSNEPAPALAAQDNAYLTQAATSSDNAVADVVNTNTGQPTQVALTPRRPDGQVDNGPDRAAVLNANLAKVSQLVAGQAADGSFDLLSLLAKAVKVSATPGQLIVVTSGLSTAGGFNLQTLGWAAQPAALAAQLKQEKLLPQLAGWHVVFSGLGDTAGRQPALPLPQQTELADYVLAICRAAGAASCGTDDVTRPDPASHSSYPDPAVAVPAVTPVPGPHGSTGESIPADVFFRINSAALLPGSNAYLAPIADKAVAEHAQVSITGYASPEAGSLASNQQLSLARARAVEAGLLALGVQPTQVTHVAGAGTDGMPASACYVGGHLDESVCAKFRRVVILLTPAPAS